MISKEEVLELTKDYYNTSKSGLANQYREAEECLAFYAGDYMKYRDYYDFSRGAKSRVKELQFQRVKPYVNSVVGFFAQIRGKPDYQAVIADNQQQRMYSEYLNNLSDYVRGNTNADQQETLQDKDMLICGYGATDTGITLKDGLPSRDPNGEIIEERIHPLHVGWDPAAIQPNLLDARWVYRVKDYYVEEAEELFDAEENDFEPAGAQTGPYEFLPGGGIQDKISYEYVGNSMNMVRVYFWQWFEVENFYMIDNPVYRATNPMAAQRLFEALQAVEQKEKDELFKFNPEAEKLVITKEIRSQVKGILKSFDIPFGNPLPQKRKVFYTAIVSGEKVFDVYKSPSQQRFAINFKTADYDDVAKMWVGMVTSMKDPVRYYNKSLTELMITIAYNSKGGVLIEEDAVDNIQEFEKNYAKTNAVVRVNPGAISGNKIMDKARPQLSTGYEQIVSIANQAITDVTGISDQFFGMAASSGNETAMLQRQKIKQATTILAVYIDNIMLYQKEQARLMLSFFRLLAQMGDGKMFTAMSEQGDIVLEQLSLDFFADEYSIKVGEAPDTPLQKEYYTQTLISMAQSMQAIGDPRYLQLYAAAVKYMPIPDRDKNDIIEIMNGDQPVDPALVEQLQMQVQQLSSQQAQLEMSKTQSQINETTAKVDKILAEIRKTDAETAKTVEDVEKQAIENDIMGLKAPADINITI